MAYTTFYSWQSDIPSSLNRSFVEDAIKKAINKIKKEFNELEFVIDRDTKDIAGSPNIDDEIFKKIANSDILICDVSIINLQDNSNSRPTPNPNVLIEFGYALKTLGSEHVIMIMNEAFGDKDKLPFDLDHRRIISYYLREQDRADTEKSRSIKEELTNKIKYAISLIVNKYPPQSKFTDLQVVDERLYYARSRFKIAIKCAIEKIEPKLIMPSFIDQFQSIEEEFEKYLFVFDGYHNYWHVSEPIKLIEFSSRITTLLESMISDSELRRRLFSPIISEKILVGKKIEFASIVTPLFEQETPDLFDIYFQVLILLDKQADAWKKTFVTDWSNGFGDQTIVNEIIEKKKYIEIIEGIRPQILKWSYK